MHLFIQHRLHTHTLQDSALVYFGGLKKKKKTRALKISGMYDLVKEIRYEHKK